MGGRQSWRTLSPSEMKDRSEAKARSTFDKMFRDKNIFKKAGIEIDKKGDMPSIENMEGELSELKDIYHDFLASEGLIDDKEAAKEWREKEDAAMDWRMATPSQREMLDLSEDKAKVDLYYSKEEGQLKGSQEEKTKWYGESQLKSGEHKDFHHTYDSKGNIKGTSSYVDKDAYGYFSKVEDTKRSEFADVEHKRMLADTWAEKHGGKVADRVRQLEKWLKPAHQKNREKIMKYVSKQHRQHTIGKAGQKYSSVFQRGVSKQMMNAKVRELYQRYKNTVGYNPKKGNPNFYKGMKKVSGSGRKKK